MTGPIVDSLVELVGSTPLVRLRRVAPEGAATIWAKCEHLEPSGSVKDRICLAMIEEAERDGRLQPGMTVVEPTSGNTGIGLALVCRVKGYKLVLTMPRSMSLERRALLQALGAEIVLTEPEKVMDGALEEARRIAKERPALLLQQFDNEANPRVHSETTAREIIEGMKGLSIDAFVASVGTGGTVTGVGRVLAGLNPKPLVCAVEPASSPVLAGGAPGPSKIQGLNAGFIPANYDASVVDRLMHVEDRDAWSCKQALAREGLLVGISSGANVHAAVQIAKELGPDKHVVTILCDTGERYFSLADHFE